ncbi:hypothetical protein [Sphingomonas sp. TZW2008]|uniref:hypothetical protein n=1 Tax=Sphingomonas sp. TZW2008 TaxID=1917973 RepID=UPI00118191A0|nr:hypothetical protein [Sphingomonas sp. TZW2008]
MTERQRERSTMLITAAVLNNLASKTWLTGISGAAEALADPERNWDSFIAQTAAGIATPAILAQIARTSDPILREARTPLDRIRSRVPGMSQSLYPRRDVFGRPIVSGGGLGPDILSPVWTGADRNDPTLRGLIDADATISPPQRSYKAGGRRVDWTPAEYDTLQRVTGETAKPQLDALVRGANWNAMSPIDRDKRVLQIMRVARKAGKSAALGRQSAPAADPRAEFKR